MRDGEITVHVASYNQAVEDCARILRKAAEAFPPTTCLTADGIVQLAEALLALKVAQ